MTGSQEVIGSTPICSTQRNRREAKQFVSLFFMVYFVYILYSTNTKRFYYGQTQDLDARLKKHNQGYVRSTKSGLPWKIVAYKSIDSRRSAIELESKLKNLHHPGKLYKFIIRHDFYIFPDQEVIGPEKNDSKAIDN